MTEENMLPEETQEEKIKKQTVNAWNEIVGTISKAISNVKEAVHAFIKSAMIIYKTIRDWILKIYSRLRENKDVYRIYKRTKNKRIKKKQMKKLLLYKT